MCLLINLMEHFYCTETVKYIGYEPLSFYIVDQFINNIVFHKMWSLLSLLLEHNAFGIQEA